MNNSGGQITKKAYVGDSEEPTEAPRSYIGTAMDRGAWDRHPEDSILQFYRIQQHSDGVTVEAVTGDI